MLARDAQRRPRDLALNNSSRAAGRWRARTLSGDRSNHEVRVEQEDASAPVKDLAPLEVTAGELKSVTDALPTLTEQRAAIPGWGASRARPTESRIIVHSIRTIAAATPPPVGGQ